MIKNERQYRITKAEAAKFQRVLAEYTTGSAGRESARNQRVQIERDSAQSQLDDLLQEIEDYDELKSGKVAVIKLDTFDELPMGLIRARIASDLSQKALAERLGLKEQQIQRYEFEGYKSASFKRMCEIAEAMGLTIREEIELPKKAISVDQFFKKLADIGIDRDFLLNRIFSARATAQIESGEFEDDPTTLLRDAFNCIERIYGWNSGQFLGEAPLTPLLAAGASARFKMPARRDSEAVSTYAVYALYLAKVVVNATEEIPQKPIPTEPKEIRKAIVDDFGVVTLETAARYCWDIGLPVLPLRDSGTFHGACWRFHGRNVIVLKQISLYKTRWLFDLIHELYHAGENPDVDELEIIEVDETSEERRKSDIEIKASQFAGDLILDGRSEELAEMCVQRANGNLRFLKNATQKVAAAESVSVGLLANYLAYRLSWQNENWWGTAANLQEDDGDPWSVVRDIFYQNFPFNRLAGTDLTLLQQALV